MTDEVTVILTKDEMHALGRLTCIATMMSVYPDVVEKITDELDKHLFIKLMIELLGEKMRPKSATETLLNKLADAEV